MKKLLSIAMLMSFIAGTAMMNAQQPEKPNYPPGLKPDTMGWYYFWTKACQNNPNSEACKMPEKPPLPEHPEPGKPAP